MNKGVALIGSIGVGAGLMYALDPDRGRRRRALMRDKVEHTINSTGHAIQTTSRDMRNRTRGVVAGAKALFNSEEVSNDVLVERIRSKLGRIVSHPHAIEVSAERGCVRLRGPILAGEVDQLVNCVSSMPSVIGVENQMEAHPNAEGVPGLQGGKERSGERFELFQQNWSPSARLLVGAAGGALMFYGAKRRDVLGATAGTLGLGLIARGFVNGGLNRSGEAAAKDTTG